MSSMPDMPDASKSKQSKKTPKVAPHKPDTPFVTVLVGNKGGIGKTTTVKVLGSGISLLGANVVIFDMEEPDYPLALFMDDRKKTSDAMNLDLTERLTYRKIKRGISPQKLKAMIDEMVGVHYVFIDTPAYNIQDGFAPMSVADLILCPGRPSRESLEKFSVFLPVLTKSFPKTPIRAFWNEAMLGESLQQEILNQTAGQTLYGCPVLSTYLTHRAAQSAANQYGLTILEYKRESDPGYQNFMTFISEFCSLSREIAQKRKTKEAV